MTIMFSGQIRAGISNLVIKKKIIQSYIIQFHTKSALKNGFPVSYRLVIYKSVFVTLKA